MTLLPTAGTAIRQVNKLPTLSRGKFGLSGHAAPYLSHAGLVAVVRDGVATSLLSLVPESAVFHAKAESPDSIDVRMRKDIQSYVTDPKHREALDGIVLEQKKTLRSGILSLA